MVCQTVCVFFLTLGTCPGRSSLYQTRLVSEYESRVYTGPTKQLWLTAQFGAILWNENKNLNKNSEQFKSFLRPMLANTVSLVHPLSIKSVRDEMFCFFFSTV